MKRHSFRLASLGSASLLSLALSGCGYFDEIGGGPKGSPITLSNKSVTPSLLKSLVGGVEIYSVISSDDL